jgi:hypothetical protein
VAAYIETLQRQAAPPTVKQHMAAIRMLFSWLTEKGVLAMNPAREVKTERFSRTEGKARAFVEGKVQTLLAAIETSTYTGLRDRDPATLHRRAPNGDWFRIGRRIRKLRTKRSMRASGQLILRPRIDRHSKKLIITKMCKVCVLVPSGSRSIAWRGVSSQRIRKHIARFEGIVGDKLTFSGGLASR